MFWQNNKERLIRGHFTSINYNFEIRGKAEKQKKQRLKNSNTFRQIFEISG